MFHRPQVPKFLPLLIFVEMWERFSFYGLTGLLTLFASKVLLLSDSQAFSLYSAYMMLAYFGPVFGGFLADNMVGFRALVIIGGTTIALGHLLIFFMPWQIDLFYWGLGFVALGTGLFKGNITNLLGACYGKQANPQMDRAAFVL